MPAKSYLAAVYRSLRTIGAGRWDNYQKHSTKGRFRRTDLRFRRLTTLQKFASVPAAAPDLFKHENHLVYRQASKNRRSTALVEWKSFVWLSSVWVDSGVSRFGQQRACVLRAP
jgi:hypothetical protein